MASISLTIKFIRVGVGMVVAYQQAASKPANKPLVTSYETYKTADNLQNNWFKSAPSAQRVLVSGGSVPNVSYNENWSIGEWVATSNSGHTWYKSPEVKHGALSQMRIDFTTTVDDQYVTFYLKAYSEENYDFILISKIDSEVISMSDYTERASGNGVEVRARLKCNKAGAHFVCVAYAKDSSGVANGDYGLVRMATNENYVYADTILYRCDGDVKDGVISWGSIYQAQGDKGDKGDKGDRGDQGEKGKYMRGPQDWDSLSDGFTFYPLDNNEVTFFDVIEYEGEYYECNKKHTKSSSATPLADYKSYGGKGNWTLGIRFSMVATKILLAQYALVKNLGVETIDMKDAEGNIIFQAKDGNVTCNSGIFNNIKVTGNSEFSGTMKAVSGSFKSLDCVDDSGKVAGNITFGSDGRMWFDGDMYSQGYRYDKQRNNRFYASDILCRGMFGHREKITAVVKGSYMYVYSKGAGQSGTYVSLKTGKTSDNKTFYYIPLYSPSDADDMSGLPIDVVVFNTSLDYYYAFSGMNNGKEWRVINGNDKQTVHFCDIAGWHSLGGGASVNCIYVNPKWLNPVPGDSGIGRGVFWTGETDLNW